MIDNVQNISKSLFTESLAKWLFLLQTEVLTKRAVYKVTRNYSPPSRLTKYNYDNFFT
jgi:hypothetical protein